MTQPSGSVVYLNITCHADPETEDLNHPGMSMSDGLMIEGGLLQQAYAYGGMVLVRRERERAGQAPEVFYFGTDDLEVINPGGTETRKDMLVAKFSADFADFPTGWGAATGDLFKVKIWRLDEE